MKRIILSIVAVAATTLCGLVAVANVEPEVKAQPEPKTGLETKATEPTPVRLVSRVRSKSELELPSPLNYQDYSSSGTNYAILKGIELKATSVKFNRTERMKVLGKDLQFRKFNVVAPVIVQIACGRAPVYGIEVARYSLSVAPDPTDIARQTFLRQIYSYWKVKGAEKRPMIKFLWLKSGRYVLYSHPVDSEALGATYLLYTSGKVIRLTLKGYQSGRTKSKYGYPYGGMSTFIENHLLFKFPNTEIRYFYDTDDISPSQFLTQYDRGDFKARPKP